MGYNIAFEQRAKNTAKDKSTDTSLAQQNLLFLCNENRFFKLIPLIVKHVDSAKYGLICVRLSK